MRDWIKDSIIKEQLKVPRNTAPDIWRNMRLVVPGWLPTDLRQLRRLLKAKPNRDVPKLLVGDVRNLGDEDFEDMIISLNDAWVEWQVSKNGVVAVASQNTQPPKVWCRCGRR